MVQGIGEQADRGVRGSAASAGSLDAQGVVLAGIASRSGQPGEAAHIASRAPRSDQLCFRECRWRGAQCSRRDLADHDDGADLRRIPLEKFADRLATRAEVADINPIAGVCAEAYALAVESLDNIARMQLEAGFLVNEARMHGRTRGLGTGGAGEWRQ